MMKRKILIHILSALMCLSMPSLMWAAEDFDYAYKISVETSLEERLKTVLAEIVPSDKIIIIVNAEIETAKNDKSVRAESQLLPGVPMKDTYGLAALGQQGKDDRHRVRRIALTILLDRGISEPVTESLKEVAKNVIGFNPDRGDQITIKQMAFGIPAWKVFLSPPNVYWLVLLLFGGFFFLTASLYLINHPFKKLSTSLQKVNWEVALTGKEPNLFNAGRDNTIVTETSVREGGKDGGSAKPFSFITSKNLLDLVFLLEDAPTSDICIVVNYIEPELATQLIESFPQERQVEIAMNLSGIKNVGPEKTRELEEYIKNWLFYKVGGEDKVASILSLAGDDVRSRVLQRIENEDGSVAERLKRKARSFETVMLELNPRSVQILYRQLDPSLFAQILKSSSEDITKKVMESLTEGAAERLKEEIDLSRPLQPDKLKKEKQNVMTVVRRMAEAGLLMEG